VLAESLDQRAGYLYPIAWDGLSLIFAFFVFLSVLILLGLLAASVESWYDLVVNVDGTFGLLRLLLLLLLLMLLNVLGGSPFIHGRTTPCSHEASFGVFLLLHWHALLLEVHPAHTVFQAWHALFLPEVLL